MASTLLLGFVLAAVLYTWSKTQKSHSRPVPPGPKPLPLVGNILNLTAKELWLRATQWAHEFGDVVYIHVFGQGLVFLNTQEAASELLDKQGSIYSDKPALVMAGDLCGCENMVAFTRYGEKSRRQRKLFMQALGPNAIRTYQPLLEIETVSLLKRMLTDPEDYVGHIRRYGGGLTLLVVYGYRVTGNNDEFLMLAEECVNILSNEIASGGGIWPVDIFPSLQHLPLWFPGAGFRRKAMTWRAKMEEFVDKPYELLRERMREGTALPCFCTTLLEDIVDRSDKGVDAQRDFDIRWSANSMYSASLDTTVTTVTHFILAMMSHPEVLKKAQHELDTVVGPGRLPTFTDRPSLPYIDAIMSEVLRWGVPVPLGLPHRLMEDDIYNGKFIAKGTLVFANIWKILRDEKLYPDPEAFNPDRFLVEVDERTEKLRDPRNAVFGFGRRRCPGSHLIESSLWILLASMVAIFDIQKPIDKDGNVIEPNVSFDNSVFRTPSPFKCDIRPRSEQALRTVRTASEAL